MIGYERTWIICIVLRLMTYTLFLFNNKQQLLTRTEWTG